MKKGDYFLDKYVLDGETSFLETTFVYRIDSIDESGEALCTKVFLSFETEKKTSKKNIVKAGVSETKISNADSCFKQIDKETWDMIVFQVYATIGTVTHVRMTLSQFCQDCINKSQDDCKFCVKENNKKPTNFKEKENE
jgi:hypothetical protein